ncbi:MAG: hypothetical protein ABIR47_14935, partial [Candidatus Kapaibacterium sp.]
MPPNTGAARNDAIPWYRLRASETKSTAKAGARDIPRRLRNISSLPRHIEAQSREMLMIRSRTISILGHGVIVAALAGD